MRLVIFYKFDDCSDVFCAWSRIESDQRAYPMVAEIIRNLLGWGDCRLVGLKPCSDPTDSMPGEVRFGIRGGDSKIKVVTAQFYVGHPNEETTTREEFTAYVKTMSGILPDYFYDSLLELSRDPITNHAELNHIMNRLLEANLDETIAAV